MIVADTETAGFFGKIRIIGVYDGNEYRDYTDVQRWWRDYRNRDDICYFHNLDFDLSKLAKELQLEIEWDKSLIIHGRIVRAIIHNASLVFADSYALLQASLEDLSRSFKLSNNIAKINLEDEIRKQGYRDKDDYFTNVDVNDPLFRQYLRNDCLSLWELLHQLKKFSGLDDKTFIKVPTASALAMQVFKQRYPEQYELLTKVHMKKEDENFWREAYYGGRTEVFRHRLWNGYHYDFTGLYPHVMGAFSYPLGYPERFEGIAAKAAWRAYQSGNRSHAVVRARIRVPDMFIPPLPVRVNKRLMFPIGEFVGTWVGEELKYAVEECDVKIIEIERIDTWRNHAQYFNGWSALIADKKANAIGAEREVYKLIGNALSGKFGMRRERPQIVLDNEKNRAMIAEKQYQWREFQPEYGSFENYLEVLKPIFAPYVQPHISAHITGYGRILLHKALIIAENLGGVWYCDTDSVVCQNPLPSEMVGNKQGQLKLENRIRQGVYIQPKFYAEITEDNKEVLKSKGLTGTWRREASYKSYEEIYNKVRNKEYVLDEKKKPIIPLYQNQEIRRKMLSALKQGKDVDEPMIVRKGIRPQAKPNRIPLYDDNITRPNQQKFFPQGVDNQDDDRVG
jgi:hypothetical protein